MPMRDSVETFIAGGGNVAFLSGNTAFWQVRLEDGGKKMVGYKGRFERDPLYGTDRQHEVTAMWSDPILERPENAMTGVTFTRGGYHHIGLKAKEGAGGYTVHRPGHWLFEGTGLEYGDVLGAASTVVGYECDGCDFTYRDGLPYPTGTDGTPDGFRLDVDGNLWCGWGMGTQELDGVRVFSPAGEPLGHIHLPERCANVCFGGARRNRLFMAASHGLYALYVNTQGAPHG